MLKLMDKKIITILRKKTLNWTYEDGRHPVGSDLGPNCLQRFSADNSKERVNAVLFASIERYSVHGNLCLRIF